ncbi:MAG: exodeoxyribonuclease VII large subunit [Bacteroidales bacterium]|nr:exodeoxyribonuclease VII large subunit [Bacteroidales bacterium]MBO7180883.1 exodeoxyribonuclease VII large subunit [Bacteroidales bacterium]
MINEKVFSLKEVASSVKRTLNARYGSSFWVKAEMIKLNHYPYSGHAFPDLIEKQDDVIVAQMRAVIWSADFKRIKDKFRSCGLADLSDGITILFRASILFDEFYGLSLRIIDIDTSFTLGEMEKQRMLCIERLKAEGIYSLNSSLSLPAVPKRFAIVSVGSSKGYNDFMQIVRKHSSRFAIFTHLFPSLLQGDGAINSISEALDRINDVADCFDAVLIIRGGGGDVGLNCYNHYNLCRAVALCKLPVLTGIGHASNQTVAEQIAWRNFITPTDLADFLFSGFNNAYLEVLNLSKQLKSNADSILNTNNERVKLLSESLKHKIENRILSEKERLQMIERYIRLLDPSLLLQKGYSMTYLNGVLVSSVKNLKSGDEIVTRFSDGEIVSKLK